MKIAAVSMTYNDGYKIKEWREHYDDYKKDIECFVIVDNGSEKEYVEQLEATFPEAVIIKRDSNGGCTAAYNDGIRYILENTNADAIALIANDIKTTENCLPALYEYLYSDELLGIVSCAMLNKDSDIVDCNGHTIKRGKVFNDDKGKRISEITVDKKYTDLVTGGFNMAKREFYERVGLQDEKLFMYCDEWDTTIRAGRAGYKLGVISNEYIWHWHINPTQSGVRKPFSCYLIARNRIYLFRKHFGAFRGFMKFLTTFFVTTVKYVLMGIVRRKSLYFTYCKYTAAGALAGLVGNMKMNKYTH